MIDALIDAVSKEIRRRTIKRDVESWAKVKAAADKYLEDLPVALWADWEITRPERRAEAATWLANQIIGVLDEMERTK